MQGSSRAQRQTSASAAEDASTINSIAVGLAASIYGAAGAAMADNNITNTVEASISNSTVGASSSVDVDATSSEIIRSIAAGIAGALGVAAQASVTDNELGSTTKAFIQRLR